MINSTIPLNPGIGIIATVPDNWNTVWTTRHKVLSRLAPYFHVVWLNPSQNWRKSIRFPFEGEKIQTYPDIPNFIEYTPSKLLPIFYRPHALGRFTNKLRLKRCVSILKERGVKKIVLYVWRPKFAECIDLFDFDLKIYHIDDEYTFSETETDIHHEEKHLISISDHVIIHSNTLMEKKGCLNANVSKIPNGVDCNAFMGRNSEPQDIIHIPSPRIGYAGIIKHQMNFDLLLGVVKKNPQWSFLFVGPEQAILAQKTNFSSLKSLPNTYFLGGKTEKELPAYIKNFDVGIMPYRINAYTNFIFPLKLLEYLAAGIPAVGTSINSLKEFSNMIFLADTVDGWSTSIVNCLHPDQKSSQKKLERLLIAKKYDWKHLVEQIADIVKDGLENNK